MAKIGSVMTPVGRKALLLGSGELGKEVALELQRYGIEVVACDRYANAPRHAGGSPQPCVQYARPEGTSPGY